MGTSKPIPLFKVRMEIQCLDLVTHTLSSGYIGQGDVVEEFEEELQVFLQSRHRPITTNSCTSALDLAFHLIRLKEKSYVISTPMTCLATNSHLFHRRCDVEWADVDPETGLIDCESVEKIVRERGEPKAVIGVDWAGRLADYHHLKEITKAIVIQDAAHSFKQSEHADYTAFSFQAIKHLTTGDGGALLVPPRLEKRARLLRWYGFDRTISDSMRCNQKISEIGYKYHMNDVAAAIGMCNILYAKAAIEKSNINAAVLASMLELPHSRDANYWFLPITQPHRESYMQYMKGRGIQCSPVHRRNDLYFKKRGKHRALPGVDAFDSTHLGIPCGWWLAGKDLDRIVEAHRVCAGK